MNSLSDAQIRTLLECSGFEERPSTVIIACPECSELGESDARAIHLTCPNCLHEWTKAPARTADETIRLVRELLRQQQDASRRRFYCATALLFKIAEAIDAYPEPPLANAEELSPCR